MVDIVITDDAIDDLSRIGPDAVPKVLKKLLVLKSNAQAAHPSSIGGPNTQRTRRPLPDGLIDR
jgi:hypothetical protein